MPEQTVKPLLMDGLTLPEKVKLGQTFLTPGYSILVKLMESACRTATEDVIKLNPEDENYDHVLKARQQYSRAVNKFCILVLRSVEYHVDAGMAEERGRQSEAEKAALLVTEN